LSAITHDLSSFGDKPLPARVAWQLFAGGLMTRIIVLQGICDIKPGVACHEAVQNAGPFGNMAPPV
jgi:hypothetical protein